MSVVLGFLVGVAVALLWRREQIEQLQDERDTARLEALLERAGRHMMAAKRAVILRYTQSRN